MSSNKLIYQIMHTLALFIKGRRRNYKYGPYRWCIVVEALHNYYPTVKVTKVIWKLPDSRWVKVNVDVVSKGNPGEVLGVLC